MGCAGMATGGQEWLPTRTRWALDTNEWRSEHAIARLEGAVASQRFRYRGASRDAAGGNEASRAGSRGWRYALPIAGTARTPRRTAAGAHRVASAGVECEQRQLGREGPL